EKLSMREFVPLVPGLRSYESLEPVFDVTLRGPADRLNVALDAHDRQVGAVNARVVVDAVGPQRLVAGDFQTERFNIGALFRGTKLTTNVTPRGTTDLPLPFNGMPLRGSYTLNVARAVVDGYEARDARARGRIDGRLVTVDAAASGYGASATAVG